MTPAGTPPSSEGHRYEDIARVYVASSTNAVKSPSFRSQKIVKILAYADEHIIRVVDVESGTSTREFVNPDWREFLGVAISPDGMVIGGLSHSRTLLWHLQGGAQPDVLEVGTQGSLFAFSPDWRFLVIHRAAAQRPHLAVYSIGEKAELSRFPAPGYQELGSLAISPNYGIAAVDRRKQSEILLRDLYDNTVLRRFTLKGYHR